MTDIVYMSLTNKTNRFVSKVVQAGFTGSVHLVSESKMPEKAKEPFVMIVPTYVIEEHNTFGQLIIREDGSESLREYLEAYDNFKLCKGLVGSGNMNFTERLYCWTALDYAKCFNLPVLMKIEDFGDIYDVQDLLQLLEEK